MCVNRLVVKYEYVSKGVFISFALIPLSDYYDQTF